MDILSVDTENHFNNYYTRSFDPEWSGWNDVRDDWRKRTIMDSLDTCVKLEMTKTGAVPGQWRISYLKWTHFFELLILVVDWCTLDFGSVVSRCCDRCGDAFSPVRIRQTVVSLPWVLPHVPCHTCIPLFATTTNLFCTFSIWIALWWLPVLGKLRSCICFWE